MAFYAVVNAVGETDRGHAIRGMQGSDLDHVDGMRASMSTEEMGHPTGDWTRKMAISPPPRTYFS